MTLCRKGLQIETSSNTTRHDYLAGRYVQRIPVENQT